MKVRGTRECKRCGNQWSYYETGSVTCPDCGSMESVGLDENRLQQTDRPATLDLVEIRNALDKEPAREVADLAAKEGRRYVRKRGFIRGGELLPLDGTYLAANELRHAGELFSRSMRMTDDEEIYFYSLLSGADEGERPDTEDLPESIYEIRGLADAESLKEYHREMGEWTREHDVSRESRSTLETLGEHVRRAQALEGGTDIDTAEVLVSAARELRRYFDQDDTDALASSQDRLDRLG